jgi:putative molybdopterin biosynthesis protein
MLVDRLLGDRRPRGYGVQTKSHNAVAAAVQQRRADWGVAINTIAEQYGLGFIPLQQEQYDFVVPTARLARSEVRLFRDIVADPSVRKQLAQMGFYA